MKTTTDPLKPVLDPARLYEGDNGRVFCGAPRCAGTSAAYAGRGLSGHPVRPLTMADLREWLDALGHAPRCERCGREAMAVLDASGRLATRPGGAR